MKFRSIANDAEHYQIFENHLVYPRSAAFAMLRPLFLYALRSITNAAVYFD